MGRAPCCSKVGLHRGPWTPREDTLLTKYIQTHGEGHWRSLPKKAGLLRCGKSCRLRWMNYLRPDIKRGNITPDEDDLIIRLHSLLGNRWSLIAGRLPGRTDNEIKNYWNTHLGKRQKNNQQRSSNNHKKSLSVRPTTIQESKKRSSKMTNKKNNTKKQKSCKKPNVVEVEKIKVHQPKPVRVTSLMSIPRNESFESSNYSTVHSGGSSQDHSHPSDNHHQDDQEVGFEFANWSNVVVDGVGFFVGNDDNLVNGSDFECQSSLPGPATDNKTLEKLYEEYLDLLKTEDEDHQIQLDSFAESLFI